MLHRPQGSSLETRLCCPNPSSLSRPHPPHSRAHRDIAALRLIRGAFAVRERLGDPRVVPGFCCTFLPDMPSSTTPGSSNVNKFQRSDADIGLRRVLSGSALPLIPQSVSRGAFISRLPGSHICYGLSGCSAPCTDPTGFPANGALPSRPEDSHLEPLSGRVGDWRAGLGRCLYSLLPRPFGCEVSQHLDHTHVSSPRHVERSVWISLTTLTCLLRIKGYGTYPAGATFGRGH
jgi:hypothetical protein